MTDPQPLPRLMVAPNGARRGKADHPALPVTLEEIVATAVACRKAGADGIHLHVRDAEGRHSIDPDLYRETVAAVRKAAPGLYIQVTSEAAGRYAAREQRDMIRALHPEAVSVALREMLRSPADTEEARAFYAWARDSGVAVQHIVYSPAELQWLINCIADGTVPGRHHQLQIVLGSYTGGDLPEPSDLDSFLALIDAQKGKLSFDWMVCAFGPAETACLAHAARRGGKMRVGFENSLWNADSSLARDNAERVREVRAALEVPAQTLSP